MSIVTTLEKRELVITLGENEAPAKWEWVCKKYVRNEEGKDEAPPHTVRIEATREDVEKHIGRAILDQAETINAMIASNDKRAAEAKEQHDKQVADLGGKLKALEENLKVVAAQRDIATSVANAFQRAEQQWQQNVGPALAQAEQAQAQLVAAVNKANGEKPN